MIMELKRATQTSPIDEKPYFEILVPGDYFCDLIFTGLPGLPELGTEMYTQNLDVVPGGILNSIVALRRLNVNVGWIGAVGNDYFSHFIMHLIEDEQIDTSLLLHNEQSLQRVTVSLSYPQDRAFITHVEPSPCLVGRTLDTLEKVTCSHLHFPGLTVDPRLPDLIASCHARNIRVSMDCQHHEYTLETPLAREILSQIDLFMPNLSEAQRLMHTDSLDDTIKALGELIPCVVIKNGSRGAVASCEGEITYEPALELSDIVDTTGAGDVFNAGFLAAYLQDMDMRDCLRWGNFCGGMSTQGPGGTKTAPTLQQVEAWCEQSPI